MGKIYKNGILFAGSTENARSVAFDNTDTRIEADNVQTAIEEVANGINYLFPVEDDNPSAKPLSSTTQTNILNIFNSMEQNTFWIGFIGNTSTKGFCIMARQDKSNRGCALVLSSHTSRIKYYQIGNGEIAGEYTINMTSV